MCGIFGYIGKKNPLKVCIQGLKLLEYRGYDSAGLAGINKGALFYEKEEGKIAVLEKKINLKTIKLDLAIGHTRWATHGSPSKKNAHPHIDHKSSLALVHNGIIENYDLIKKKLLKKNIQFTSDTDTEVIAQLISYHYKNDILEATKNALKEIKGSLAIALIHKDYPDQIIAFSRESPLVIGYDDKRDETLISSDPNAFLGRNLNVLFLKNDELAQISAKSIKVYNQQAKIVIKKTERFNSQNSLPSKEGFEHFMLKEIFEQPLTIQKAFLGRIQLEKGSVEFENLDILEDTLTKTKQIIILACGTSWHAATTGAFFLQEKAKIPTFAEIASEARFKNLLITKDTLVIAISQSGETADTLAAIRVAKNQGAKILGICNVNNSTITRESDNCIFLKAGPEFSVCSTKAFTSQITVLYLLSIYIARLKSMNKTEGSFLLKELKKIPKNIQKVLNLKQLIMEKAEKYYQYDNFFFLGRNHMYPTSLEAALKLKEISYLNANAYPAGEMKHGPIALINENLPIIAFCSNEKTYDKMLSNLMEVKARSAPILAIASEGAYGIKDIADDVIFVPKTIDELAIFPSSVAGQLLAYYIAKKRKTDIDHPRNLAKSVTVE